VVPIGHGAERPPLPTELFSDRADTDTHSEARLQ
jgi:hypothetical protein